MHEGVCGADGCAMSCCYRHMHNSDRIICRSRIMLGVCLAHCALQALASRSELGIRGRRGRQHSIGRVERSLENAGRGLRLRGGGATSGIWDTFTRMKGDATHNLHEVKPQEFNQTSVSIHRANEAVNFAIMCDAKPFRGDTVEAVGVWSDGSGATREIKVSSSEACRCIKMCFTVSIAAGSMHEGSTCTRIQMDKR